MPSLADIPAHLRRPDRKIQFIEWLNQLPAAFPIRRQLASLWARDTATTFNSFDWALITQRNQFDGVIR